MAIITNIELLINRRTKIVATVGPASSSANILEALILAGVNVFRLNMSHGDHNGHKAVYENIRSTSDRLKCPVAVLADLCGPKIRTGKFPDGGLDLVDGSEVIITTDQANFNGNYTYNGSDKGVYRKQTAPVGSFPANAFGLHDMHGNVYEYTEDCFHETYEGAPVDGSPWISEICERRVQRDGSWKGRPPYIRVAARSSVVTNYGRDSFGFRVARDLAP